MFFILSKTLYFLLMPVTWIVLAFLCCALIQKYRKQFFLLGFALLLLFTNAFISNRLISWWEVAPVRISSLTSYEVGIVLGGLTSDKEPYDRVHVTGAADRILQAVHLYRLGKIRKILVSGGSGKLLKDSIPEAVLLKQILEQCKVPEQDILLESDSRNTHENAVNSTSLLEKNFPEKSYLLITSAYHMRRATACFQKTGLPIDVFPVDQKSSDMLPTPDVLLIPNTEALSHWESVIREMMGMAAYQIAGYI